MLLKIDLPNPYEDAIVMTQVTNQQRLTMVQESLVNMTKQMTENIKEAALARIKIINAQAQADADAKTWEGRGNITQARVSYTTQGLKAVQDELSLDPKTSLMDYYYLQKIGMMDGATKNKLLVGKMQSTILTGDML